MAAIAEGRHGLAAQLLPHRAKPSFGPLPRGIVAIKLVRAEGAVACGKQQIGDAEPRAYPAFGGGVFVAIVAVGHESRGKIALRGHAATQAAARSARQQRFLVRLEAALARAQKDRALIGSGGQKIHHPAQSVHAVQRGTRAFEHLDRVHRLQRHGQIEIVVRCLRVINAEAVEQHQRLLKAAAAQHQVSLSAARAALFEKNRRVRAQKILRRLGGQRFSLHRQNLHGALRLGQRHGRGRAEHDHSFRGSFNLRRRRRGVLREGRAQRNREQ